MRPIPHRAFNAPYLSQRVSVVETLITLSLDGEFVMLSEQQPILWGQHSLATHNTPYWFPIGQSSILLGF
jgi:hypothetical protein